MTGKKRKTTSAEEWAKRYFGPFAHRSRESTRALLAAGVNGARLVPTQVGLPEGFPEPVISDDDFWVNQATCEDAARQAYEHGYGEALLEYASWHFQFAHLNRSNVTTTDAIRRVAMQLLDRNPSVDLAVAVREIRKLTMQLDNERFEVSGGTDDLPYWIQDALRRTFRLWLEGQITKLDDGLALKRTQRKRAWEHRAKLMLVEAFEDGRRSEVATDQLLELLGKRLSPEKSASTVARILRSAKRDSGSRIAPKK
jgi:hypothetical protein